MLLHSLSGPEHRLRRSSYFSKLRLFRGPRTPGRGKLEVSERLRCAPSPEIRELRTPCFWS
eukprot:4979052-Alexandrium_andersonii.AAC.1